MHDASSLSAFDGDIGVDSALPTTFQETYGTENASLGSANHFSGGCRPCSWFLKGRCLHGFTCQHCHMNHKGEERKKKGKHRKPEFRLSEDPLCQLQEQSSCQVKLQKAASRGNLDILSLLTEPLKVHIAEDNMDLGRSNDLPLPVVLPFPIASVTDGTCPVRAVREDVNFPVGMGTLPEPSHAELLDPFCHSSTNPVEPLGLQKAGRAASGSGYLKHLQELGSQCANDVQEHYIRELETQNAFLRMCLMQCFQTASASL
jgi:hypothetical protein